MTANATVANPYHYPYLSSYTAQITTEYRGWTSSSLVRLTSHYELLVFVAARHNHLKPGERLISVYSPFGRWTATNGFSF